jgi:hypothetical protein
MSVWLHHVPNRTYTRRKALPISSGSGIKGIDADVPRSPAAFPPSKGARGLFTNPVRAREEVMRACALFPWAQDSYLVGGGDQEAAGPGANLRAREPGGDIVADAPLLAVGKADDEQAVVSTGGESSGIGEAEVLGDEETSLCLRREGRLTMASVGYCLSWALPSMLSSFPRTSGST